MAETAQNILPAVSPRFSEALLRLAINDSESRAKRPVG